ncbi:hypothetical protein B0H17DRAFT_1228373 [Mycena rosella]|uniref:Uncharacterized protein n=1 Tax=Mycena rosella TaxID=1033263 RepID=A0AAD7D7E7_MYCRO|nr:hypothetical protein B0H17DRAFT_1228373 [Mycena rosella]
MSSANITCFRARTSRPAILFNDGSPEKPNFPASFVLCATFNHPWLCRCCGTHFSGGSDTISLRRASLNSDTIRTLMMVKQRLHLARNAVKEIL